MYLIKQEKTKIQKEGQIKRESNNLEGEKKKKYYRERERERERERAPIQNGREQENNYKKEGKYKERKERERCNRNKKIASEQWDQMTILFFKFWQFTSIKIYQMTFKIYPNRFKSMPNSK